MLSVYLIGLILWLIYGVALHAKAVVLANAASGALVACAILTKAGWAGSKSRSEI